MKRASSQPRPRRFRVKDNPPGYRLDARKIKLLRALARDRFLTSAQLADIDGGSTQKVLRILRTLYDHGLVTRPLSQRVQMAGRENRPLVYSLTHRGAHMLADMDGTSARDYNWTTKVRRRTAIHIQHAVDIAAVMRTFARAIERRQWGLLDHRALIPTFPEATRTGSRGKSPFSLRVVIQDADAGEPRPISVIPDRLFSPCPPGSRFNFALELDEGGMPVFRWKNRKRGILKLDETSIARKLIVYHEAWRQDLHVTRWGFRQIRILFVTASKRRIEEMLEAVRFATNGKGTRLFAFTDFATLSANDPFSPIWIDGKGDATALLE